MFTRVRLKKSALNYFRKKARESSGVEIQAFLLGNIISMHEVEISEFLYPKEYHTQTPSEVSWTADEYAQIWKKADEKGLSVLGDFHTHPSWDAVMSGVDYRGAVTSNFVICGICSVYDRKTRVRIWTPTSSLPLTIVYT